eukprot:gene9197-10171_t
MKPLIKDDSASVALVQSRLNQLQEELDNERDSRLKSERRCMELEQELSIVCEQLDETGGVKALQQCKRQEDEITKLRRSLEEAARQEDDAMSVAKMKHTQDLRLCEEEIETLKKTRTKIDREKTELSMMFDQMADELEISKRDLSNFQEKASHFEAKFTEEHSKSNACGVQKLVLVFVFHEVFS